MITRIALFQYADGRGEFIAHTDEGKVMKRTAPSVAKLMARTPQEVRDALKEMRLVKTRETDKVRGEWYERG
jgi:hypothetical protein